MNSALLYGQVNDPVLLALFVTLHEAQQSVLLSPPPPEGGGVLLGILGRGVPPGSSNPGPISDQKMSFSTPVFRIDL